MSTAENAGVENTEWSPVQWVGAVVLWLWVAVPLAYGLYQLVVRIPALFSG